MSLQEVRERQQAIEEVRKKEQAQKAIPVWKYGPSRDTAVQPTITTSVPLRVKRQIQREEQYQREQQPVPKTVLTSGQQVSSGMRNVGYSLWYGKNTKPEQVWQGPDLRYSYGQSTKQIMAETVTDIGIGVTTGNVYGIVAPIGQRSVGIGYKIYRAADLAMKGGFLVGTGLLTVQTAQKIQQGDTRGASADILKFGAGLFAFGATGGRQVQRERNLFKQAQIKASEINIRTGTPGSIQPGRGSTLVDRTYLLSDRTTGRGVRQFEYTEDYIFKQSNKLEFFIDKQFNAASKSKIISFGGAEAQARLSPNIAKPIRMDILTGMEHTTSLKGNRVLYTRSFMYQSYEPPFIPMKTTPTTRITGPKATFDFLTNVNKISSGNVKGAISRQFMPDMYTQTSRTGLISILDAPVETPMSYPSSIQKPTMQLSVNAPVFRATMPNRAAILPVYTGYTRQASIKTGDTVTRMQRDMLSTTERNTRFFEIVGYKNTLIDRLTPGQRDITTPVVVPRITTTPRTTIRTTPDLTAPPITIPDIITTTDITRVTIPGFPLLSKRGLRGPGGFMGGRSLSASSKYKFREFKIPDMGQFFKLRFKI